MSGGMYDPYLGMFIGGGGGGGGSVSSGHATTGRAILSAQQYAYEQQRMMEQYMRAAKNVLAVGLDQPSLLLLLEDVT
jgi:hypothetical protein